MKHCPECNKNYADPTLSFCLEDGSPLIFGPAVTEPDTGVSPGDFSSEAPTRNIDPHTTAPTESLRFPGPESSTVRSGRKLYWLAGACALVLIAIASFIGYRYYNSSATNSTDQIESVAVLPFENGSGSADMDYLSDGVSATLIDKLSQLPQLKKVIACTSSFKYRDPNPDIQAIAAKLGVQAVVTGRVAKVGDQLIVRVELVDASENKQIWGDQFNRRFADAVGLQQEIAQTVAEKLRLKLTGAQEQQLAKAGTNDPRAYELFLKGEFFHQQGGRENRKKADQYFEQAIAVDPQFALAYAELSQSYGITAGNSAGDPKVYLPKAEAAAQKAFELDPNLPEAHRALASVYFDHWKWEDAEREYKRAIELNPNFVDIHRGYAFYLAIIGKQDEGVAEARRALELDPVSLSSMGRLALCLQFARRFDESIQTANRAIELDPNYVFGYVVLGYSYAGAGRYREAIQAILEIKHKEGKLSPSEQIFLGAAYANSGDRAKAMEILDQVRSSEEYVSPGELPVLLAALGDKEAAFASLEKAFEAHDLQLMYLKVDPAFDPLRGDPRLDDLIRRIGLPQ